MAFVTPVFVHTPFNCALQVTFFVPAHFFNEKALGYDKLNCHVIEFYFLMKSRGKKDAICNTRGWDNAKESICWIPLDELADTNVKPDFLRYRMNEILEGKGIIHIITDDR